MKMRLYSMGSVRALQLTCGLVVAMVVLGFLGFGQAAKAQVGFSLGDATNYAILDEGEGHNDLVISGDTITGNIGIGDPSGSSTTQLQLGGDTINGNINFAGAIDDTGTNGSTINGSVNGGITQVQTDLNYLNSLSASLATETGTSVSVLNGSTYTFNANSGHLDSSGNYVFNVTTWNQGSGDTITINGDNLGHNVVFNFVTPGINPTFHGDSIILSGGLTASDVLFNIANGDTLTLAGDTITGTYLDPNGTINGTGTTLNGHVFGGGTGNSTYSGDTINDPNVSPSH